jgi:hypothetical protein
MSFFIRIFIRGRKKNGFQIWKYCGLVFGRFLKGIRNIKKAYHLVRLNHAEKADGMICFKPCNICGKGFSS